MGRPVVQASAIFGLLLMALAAPDIIRGQVAAPPAQPYEVITKGLLGDTPFSVQFRSAPLRLEIRNLIMGPGITDVVPTANRALMELRGGGVVTTINGQRQERRQGDFWTVEKGSRLIIESTGDVAVIRAIYVIEGQK